MQYPVRREKSGRAADDIFPELHRAKFSLFLIVQSFYCHRLHRITQIFTDSFLCYSV